MRCHFLNKLTVPVPKPAGGDLSLSSPGNESVSVAVELLRLRSH